MSDLRYVAGWVSDEGATLCGMMEHGTLWVAERLPPAGAGPWRAWEIVAEPADTTWKILGRWLTNDVPRSLVKRTDRLREAIRLNGYVVLVVQDAHLWRPSLQRHMRLFAEALAPVLMVGDVVKIATAVGDDESFMGRASFCIEAQNLFVQSAARP